MESLKILLAGYMKAPKIIRELKLRWMYFLSLFVAIILLAIFYYIAQYVGDNLVTKLIGVFHIKSGDTLTGILKTLFKIILYIILVFIFYIVIRTIMLIILSPFLGYLSEKMEEEKYGNSYKFSLRENIGFIFRGLSISMKSFIKEIFSTLLISLLGFVPGVNVVVPGMLFLVQSYFVALNFIDYALERRKFTSEDTFRFMKENRVVLCIGGAIFTLLYLIPVVGVGVAPLWATVAFTSLVIERLENRDLVKTDENE